MIPLIDFFNIIQIFSNEVLIIFSLLLFLVLVHIVLHIAESRINKGIIVSNNDSYIKSPVNKFDKSLFIMRNTERCSNCGSSIGFNDTCDYCGSRLVVVNVA